MGKFGGYKFAFGHCDDGAAVAAVLWIEVYTSRYAMRNTRGHSTSLSSAPRVRKSLQKRHWLAASRTKAV